ncbi:TonB-dependent receptor [Thalassotalea euphylliae]|uniref:TonB-dependent receptor n=1 Tax=Thalassotalea euphylliae TaxID=1655234 RepID=A0A3E0U5W0_9GAMM|nr:TonB-dependent receptor [Thalassotalea euphylliae]REL32316.1 TonB-dependent receptor [Thalassotalea euphylliae]
MSTELPRFKRLPIATAIMASLAASSIPSAYADNLDDDAGIEEIIIVAEKRNESLQDVSQAVTAVTGEDLLDKNILSFVDLSAIAPGVTVAKNEGFKTIISIRGVGNEANQNIVANPSVSYHMDGIYIASPFALQTDFIDVELIEVLRGPQGTLFGQNSTGGAINVISKRPELGETNGKFDYTFGEHSLSQLRGSVNLPIGDSAALRTSVSKYDRDGFSKNVLNGQDLDDADNLTIKTDFFWQATDNTNLRLIGQFFEADSNGAAIKGIDDPTPGARNLAQDTESKFELDSKLVGLIVESDLGFATAKYLGSWQEDEILVQRDNDRHAYGTNPEYTISAFLPEINNVETFTHEINLISNEPAFGKLDWIVGAFYLDTDIEVTIREELDANGNGVLDGYVPSFPDVFAGDVGFISDATPSRESFSIYGQTTYNFNDTTRLITGLRYTKDDVESAVSNFFAPEPTLIEASVEEVTGRIAVEYDISDDIMVYGSYTRGFKPGGSNLTFGFEPGEFDFISGAIDNSEPLVFPTFENETINAYELGIKAELLDNRLRTNLATFFYDYQNLQFQATDPNAFQGGVANIPEAEITGLELELIALLTDDLILDVKMSALDSEITQDYFALDNVVADGLGFVPGDDVLRSELAENVKGNELAKAPGFTMDASLEYTTNIASHEFRSVLQYTYRGEFEQRIFNNPAIDQVDDYEVVNLRFSLDLDDDTWGFDLMATNVFDKDGVNSRMSDVFGVNATGEELIAPRQVMARVRYSFY